MGIKNCIKELSLMAKTISNFDNIDEINCVNKWNQILLRLKYRELFENSRTVLSFDDIEFRAFSQNGEDVILHYIF